MDSCLPTPPLVKIDFIGGGKDPSLTWKSCEDRLKAWKRNISISNPIHHSLRIAMERFKRDKTVEMILLSNYLEGTLPEGSENKEKLEGILHEFLSTSGRDVAVVPNSPVVVPDVKTQLAQHLNAYLYLCEGNNLTRELSEDVIKQTHRIMMSGLITDDDKVVLAGEYRSIAVHAGMHNYPPFECIPQSMSSIVAEYNKRFEEPHDMYQLASWLLFQVVSLHPFEDGNGRLCRLLWCYSLMRDGLPFPLTISSGHKKAQKHFVWCLKRSSTYNKSNHPHVTMLTVHSIFTAWSDFFSTYETCYS